MKLQALLLPAAMLALALAGCTGTSNGDDCETPPMENGAYVIEMLPSNRFSPACAEVPVGATVVWKNEGGAHNVVPDGHTMWEETTISSETGAHHQVTLNEAGEYDYFCRPHRSLGMTGTIKVV